MYTEINRLKLNAQNRNEKSTPVLQESCGTKIAKFKTNIGNIFKFFEILCLEIRYIYIIEVYLGIFQKHFEMKK